MRVALVHDWLTGMRGGERVLHEIAAVFPGADLHTLIHVPGSTSARIEALRVRASPLSRLPGARRHYRLFLPLYPWAVERLPLDSYDLVLSTSHAFAKSVRLPPGVPHVCYCFTPMRYVWDQRDAYLGHGLRRVASWPLAQWLRSWDRRTSGPERVTRFLATSHTAAGRIQRHYGRHAEVIHPPVDLDLFRPRGDGHDGSYLLVGGFVPYKREDLVVEAFRHLDRTLVVAGDGPGRRKLERGAPPNVTFLGHVSDARLSELYSRCRALVFPQEEDFGLVALEAQACGRPVIAFGRGGATESVVPLDDPAGRAPTGMWFQEQTAEALAAAIVEFERVESRFDPAAIRAHAESFGSARFRRAIATAVEETVGRRAPEFAAATS